MEKTLPSLKIKDKEIPVCIIQGGMGVGVSLSPLASAVAQEGGLGIVSSAGLDLLVSKRVGHGVKALEAAYQEITWAKEKGGFVGINIMVALSQDYVSSVKGAIDAGADCIISGAGLPTSLPAIQKTNGTALIPIVSSARALEIICKKWERQKYQPDAVVLEGPLAGGHLGFKINDLYLEANTLEELLPSVKDVAMRHGDFPVIVAGGIFTHGDIVKFLALGADGVQMGTRFLATVESSASESYKNAVVNCAKEDIVVADPETCTPGSPCGLPFRVIKQSPMFQTSHLRKPLCNKGYVLRKDKEGNFSVCSARDNCSDFLCICNGLLSSAGYETQEPQLWTVGTNAYRVNKIMSVKHLMDELKGVTPH